MPDSEPLLSIDAKAARRLLQFAPSGCLCLRHADPKG